MLILHRVYLTIKKAAELYRESRMEIYSAQASFFILLSSVPFLMLTLMTANLFLPMSGVELAVLVGDIVPAPFRDIFLQILDEISTLSTSTAISVTLVASLWSASRGVKAVSGGISYMYGKSERQGGLRLALEAVLYTVVFMLMLVFLLAFIVFGDGFFDFARELLPPALPVLALLEALRGGLAFIFPVLFFALVYRTLGGRGKPLSMQLPGAAAASLGWVGFSYLYSFYYSRISGFSRLYGSMAAVMLLMLWLYLCMNILLIGAALNHRIEGCFVRSAGEK